MPYDLTPEFLHELFTKHKIDYVLHGDDPCLLPDGTDAYEHAKRLGRFKMVGGWVGQRVGGSEGQSLHCQRVVSRCAAGGRAVLSRATTTLAAGCCCPARQCRCTYTPVRPALAHRTPNKQGHC